MLKQLIKTKSPPYGKSVMVPTLGARTDLGDEGENARQISLFIRELCLVLEVYVI